MEVPTIILNGEHIARLSHTLCAETSECCGIIQQLKRLLSNIASLTDNIVATMVVGAFLYKNAPIRGLALSKQNICEISHKKIV